MLQVTLQPNEVIVTKLCTFYLVTYVSYLQVTIAKDPDAKFFKKLDGFQACEVNELRAGTHTFAVYGKLHIYAISSSDFW